MKVTRDFEHDFGLPPQSNIDNKQMVRSLHFFFSEAWRLGARLGGGVAGLFGQRRQCRLRGKVNIGQVIISCVGITHFLSWRRACLRS